MHIFHITPAKETFIADISTAYSYVLQWLEDKQSKYSRIAKCH